MATDGPLPIPAQASRVPRDSRQYSRFADRYAPAAASLSDEVLESPSGYSDWAPQTIVLSAGSQKRLKATSNEGAKVKNVDFGSAGFNYPSPSPSTHADAFQDCTSDINSVLSSEVDDSSCDGGGHSRANSAREGEAEGQSGSSEYDAFVSDWYTRFQDEHKQRIRLEEEVASLKEALQQAQVTLLAAQEQRSNPESRSQEEAHVEAARTLVARLVGSILGRAEGADAANRAQQAEIEALHQRIERLSGMEAALERKREREKEQHDTFMRRLGHGLMAAACVAAVTRFQGASRGAGESDLASGFPLNLAASSSPQATGLALALEPALTDSGTVSIIRPTADVSASVASSLARSAAETAAAAGAS